MFAKKLHVGISVLPEIGSKSKSLNELPPEMWGGGFLLKVLHSISVATRGNSVVRQVARLVACN